ncbi:Cupin domain-containing protein [Prosthecobacter fusiformis]|uniref:Cupin domain-containing protein n=1 Tax=Prosthecobacter fusiformis TaxID=48464 RepID=A0A4R7RLD7_9BACT|nr:cupin domain-containing protein [Prosthecobacter fusiformis]TDU66160.1 Cupin domain-containing protein [Prosthecobacter fusiformis]
MNRTHSEDLPWNTQNSPQRKYGVMRRGLSQAAGCPKDTGTWGGGHPFEVEIHRVAPGKINFPLHEHSAQWEAYYILSGMGQVRGPKGTESIQAGDYLVFPPGEAHQIINHTEEELTFMVIADQPQADAIHYPESGKWLLKPQKKCFEMNEVDYFKGEE